MFNLKSTQKLNPRLHMGAFGIEASAQHAGAPCLLSSSHTAVISSYLPDLNQLNSIHMDSCILLRSVVNRQSQKHFDALGNPRPLSSCTRMGSVQLPSSKSLHSICAQYQQEMSSLWYWWDVIYGVKFHLIKQMTHWWLKRPPCCTREQGVQSSSHLFTAQRQKPH